MAPILRNGGSQSPDRWLKEPRNNHFVSLLYVLSPEMAGQMVVQMRVPEINLAHGLQAQAANDLYRYF